MSDAIINVKIIEIELLKQECITNKKKLKTVEQENEQLIDDNEILKKKNLSIEKQLKETEILNRKSRKTVDQLEQTLAAFEEHDQKIFEEIQNKYSAIINSLQANLRTSTPRKDTFLQINDAEIKRLQSGYCNSNNII